MLTAGRLYYRPEDTPKGRLYHHGQVRFDFSFLCLFRRFFAILIFGGSSVSLFVAFNINDFIREGRFSSL